MIGKNLSRDSYFKLVKVAQAINTPQLYQDYVVKPKDTLSGIAREQLGNASYWKQLYELNKDVIGGNPNLIRPNQHLKIPTPAGLEHLMTKAPSSSEMPQQQAKSPLAESQSGIPSRKATTQIVIHTTASGGANIGNAEIDKMHKGFGWQGTGYHYVIRKDGTVEQGRPEEAVGAHEVKANGDSIGIAWVGGPTGQNPTMQSMKPEDRITSAQWSSMASLVNRLIQKYQIPVENVRGHSDYANKLCPAIDMNKFRSSLTPPQSQAEVVG